MLSPSLQQGPQTTLKKYTLQKSPHKNLPDLQLLLYQIFTGSEASVHPKIYVVLEGIRKSLLFIANIHLYVTPHPPGLPKCASLVHSSYA